MERVYYVVDLSISWEINVPVLHSEAETRVGFGYINANSSGFPGSLQPFHQISRSPSQSTNLPGNAFLGLFQNFFINFIIFESSKRKIKQEVNLVLLFELNSNGKCYAERSN